MVRVVSEEIIQKMGRYTSSRCTIHGDSNAFQYLCRSCVYRTRYLPGTYTPGIKMNKVGFWVVTDASTLHVPGFFSQNLSCGVG